ncbi:MAG: GDYXXLXY domain-containing protein [Alphaproteobacteria bacterium]|nr:GDYXXLXY domain-containing protein [Alphaproteobacteria bacterium]MBO6629492.1 GDYXXLXY domain-containing protein [Alphaproteobacteria bacterium]MDF1627230.1 GDYXXLXY domain-containing protein [Parvibaculaceae bacterium]
MTRTRIIIGITVAVLFQTAILSQMVLGQVRLLNSPIEAVLKTRPVDPRDIFRGDYVILNYEMEQLRSDQVEIADNLKTDQDIYIVLSLTSPYATPLKVLASPPGQLEAGQAVIRGTLNWFDGGENPTTDTDCIDCKNLFINLPIDSYFVPEGTGTDIEEYRNERALGVIVALNEDGDAAIKGLMLDGRKVYDEPLF